MGVKEFVAETLKQGTDTVSRVWFAAPLQLK